MDTPELRIRRGRRQDFVAVRRLLGSTPEAEADRRTLRRFRHIAADLGADLYVAHLAGKVVGVVHVSYARQITGGQRARIEDLAADREYGQHSIESRLLAFALERARKRACGSLGWSPSTADAGAAAEGAGLQPQGTEYLRPIASEA